MKGGLPMSTEPMESLVDLGRLSNWIGERELACGPITNVTRLGGGSQNVILRVTQGGRDFVLRRPPVCPRAESNETMRREARVLEALAHTDVPHPRLIAACSDEKTLGFTFYLMEPVVGFNAVAGLPALHTHSRALRHRMGLALVDGAAALARVDYRAVGLEGFGKAEGYLERQVSRWRSQLASYASYAGWPGAQGLSGLSALEEYLQQNRPAASEPGIIHGDYSIGNVMYRYDNAELAAIVDWELATVGDPLIDLGWILATWRTPEEVDIGVLRVEPFDGFPTTSELVERYAAQSERDLSSLDWYVVMACYKLAIILEGTFVRAHAGLASMEIGLKLHTAAIRLCERALQRIGSA